MDGSASMAAELAALVVESPEMRMEQAVGLKKAATTALRVGTPGDATKLAGKAADIFDGLAYTAQQQRETARQKRLSAATEDQPEQEETEEETAARKDRLKYLGLGGRSHAIAAKAYEALYRKSGDVEHLDGAIRELVSSLKDRTEVGEEQGKETSLVLPRRKLGRLLFERALIAMDTEGKVEERKGTQFAAQCFAEAANLHGYNRDADFADIPASYRHSLFQSEVYADWEMAWFGIKAMQMVNREEGMTGFINTLDPELKSLEFTMERLAAEPNDQAIVGKDSHLTGKKADKSFEKAKWLTRMQTRFASLLMRVGRQDEAQKYLTEAGSMASKYNLAHEKKPLPTDILQNLAIVQEEFRSRFPTPSEPSSEATPPSPGQDITPQS